MNFIAYGHENILAKHKTTLEFTKDDLAEAVGEFNKRQRRFGV